MMKLTGILNRFLPWPKIRIVLSCKAGEAACILSLQSGCKVSSEFLSNKVIRHFTTCNKGRTFNKVAK